MDIFTVYLITLGISSALALLVMIIKNLSKGWVKIFFLFGGATALIGSGIIAWWCIFSLPIQLILILISGSTLHNGEFLPRHFLEKVFNDNNDDK